MSAGAMTSSPTPPDSSKPLLDVGTVDAGSRRRGRLYIRQSTQGQTAIWWKRRWVWGDHTWYGSFPRKNDGLRLMMLGTYCRPHMQTGLRRVRPRVPRGAGGESEREQDRLSLTSTVPGRPSRKKPVARVGLQQESVFAQTFGRSILREGTHGRSAQGQGGRHHRRQQRYRCWHGGAFRARGCQGSSSWRGARNKAGRSSSRCAMPAARRRSSLAMWATMTPCARRWRRRPTPMARSTCSSTTPAAAPGAVSRTSPTRNGCASSTPISPAPSL